LADFSGQQNIQNTYAPNKVFFTKQVDYETKNG
jgi:hypothetical protein